MRRNVLYALTFLVFLSCDDFDLLTLPRDNPNDVFNDDVYQDGISLMVESFEIVEEDNRDGFANKNETVYCRISIKNHGENNANEVRGVVTTDSELIQNLTEEAIHFNSGDPNRDVIGSNSKSGYIGRTPYNEATYSFSFNVSENVHEAIVVPFELIITDKSDHQWTETLELTVRPTNADIEFSHYKVQQDNNMDGYVNINEQIYMLVYLKNAGTSPAENVRASISSESEYVTEIYPDFELTYNSANTNYTHIGPGDERYSRAGVLSGSKIYNLIFQLSPNTPDKMEVPFTMDIHDEQGNSWSDEFTVNVLKTAAELRVSQVLVIGDDNGNGKVNPGEKVYLRVYLENIGASRANGVMVEISPTSHLISNVIPDEPWVYRYSSNFNYIPAGGEVYGYYSALPGSKYYSLEFDISSDIVPGEELNFNVAMEDAEGNVWEDSFSLEVE